MLLESESVQLARCIVSDDDLSNAEAISRSEKLGVLCRLIDAPTIDSRRKAF